MAAAPHPRMHGLTHVPGGPDPIPGLTGPALTFADTIFGIAADHPNHLLGYWRLGETGTPWLDTSGNTGGPHNMALTDTGATVTPDVTGALTAGDDGAVRFNYDGHAASGGRYLQAAASSAFYDLNQMTVACYAKVTSSSDTRRGEIVGNMAWAAGGFRLGWAVQVMYPGRAVRFSRGQSVFGGAEYYAETPGTLTADQWYFLVGTYDGANVRLYVDGSLAATTADTRASAVGSSQGCKIGYEVGNFEHFWFTGSVDEVSVWDVALTPAEIGELYTAGASSSGGGGAPSGAAGGDLSGSYPNPQLAAGSIVDADVNAAANIDPTKLSHPGGTTTFLRADGTWAAPAGTSPADTAGWLPLTTVVVGVPDLVWDATDSLIPTYTPF